MILEGNVWKFGDSINTNLMMPGSRMTVEESAPRCMMANRPEWAAQVRKGDIIIAGRNWGCGSSRPAESVLKLLGISAVVADSMGRIFFKNAINRGLPVLICPGVSQIFAEGDRARVNVETGEVMNLSKGTQVRGEALPADSPPMQILLAGGLEAFMRQQEREGGQKTEPT
jgi:3-isopropylmalate/(R)-2-methylmalate dehydratase small subunit